MLRDAIRKYLADSERRKQHKHSKNVVPHGKQSVKELVSQGQGASNIEASKLRIPSFDSVARKYGVDYAIRREGDKHLIFFKARDADAINAAFQEYSKKEIRRDKAKESVLAKLERFAQLVKDKPRETEKSKDKELSL